MAHMNDRLELKLQSLPYITMPPEVEARIRQRISASGRVTGAILPNFLPPITLKNLTLLVVLVVLIVWTTLYTFSPVIQSAWSTHLAAQVAPPPTHPHVCRPRLNAATKAEKQ